MDKYLKNKRIKLKQREELEPQEILLDTLAQKKEEELGISEKKLEVPILKKILQGLFFISCGLIFILFVKTFQLQVIEGKNFTLLAESNKFKIYQIQAERGVIYDQKGNQLVFNSSSFDLVLNKRDFNLTEKKELEILKKVSEILKQDISKIKKKIEESKLPEVEIAENLDYLTLIILETKIANNELPGFKISQKWIREYKDGPIFSHLLGYTGKISPEEFKKNSQFYTIFDLVGRSGLEQFYEGVLRKNPGKMRIERDALGNVISQEIVQLPEFGNSLVLWLDSGLQKKIREVLERQRQAIGAKAGAAVALDPKTGGVLAMVSLPDFDNNLFQKETDPEKLQEILENPLKPLFNRAISGQGYLPGSTIKPLIALAALEEKIISPEKQIYSGGFIEVKDKYNPDKSWIFRDWKTHGWTDLRKAIAQSVNVYFYIVGGGYGEIAGLGPNRIKKYLELFGWGEKTGIDLPNEGEGFIPSPEWKKTYFGKKENQIWYDGNTYYLSIGQEYVSATPFQAALSISVIANGGKLFQPRLVKEIVNNKKEVVEKINPKIIRENFIEPKNIQIVREGMRQTVTQGSATGWLNLLPVTSAAKTGTAQTGKFNKYGQELFNKWVTVFAPYEDPQIILTIMLEDVSTMTATVLPPAKEILEWYFSK